jgi:hypothetical protein
MELIQEVEEPGPSASRFPELPGCLFVVLDSARSPPLAASGTPELLFAGVLFSHPKTEPGERQISSSLHLVWSAMKTLETL